MDSEGRYYWPLGTLEGLSPGLEPETFRKALNIMGILTLWCVLSPVAFVSLLYPS